MSGRVRAFVTRATDLVRDVTIEAHARRARAVLLLTAVALSTGALVSSVGISTVAAHQVDADLAASTVNLITVTPSGAVDVGYHAGPVEVFPPDADDRATTLGSVEAAGRRLDYGALTTVVASRDQPGHPAGDPVGGVTICGVTSGYLDAIEAGVVVERTWVLDTDQRAVFLGATAADAFDIPVTDDPTGYSIWINGSRYPVAGFLDGGSVDVSTIVAVPYSIALRAAGSDTSTRMLVRTVPGGGGPVVDVIRHAVRPDAPERLSSSQVSTIADLRAGVSTQLGRFAAWVGAFLLLVTALLIANAMIVSVMSRTTEIGLRRAMGASAGSIAAMILSEGGLTGALGGLAGGAVSAVTIVTVAAANSWTVILDPAQIAAAPAVGVVAGLVSALYPALRAARVQPAIAVRSE